MTESRTLIDDNPEPLDNVVDFVALLMAKQKETQEAQIEDMLKRWKTFFDSTIKALAYEDLRQEGCRLLYAATKEAIERAYLNAEMNQTKTSLAIEKESLRRARETSG